MRGVKSVIRADKCTIRVVPEFLMLSHLLTNFEIPKYYQNETKFNGAYSRNNLHKKVLGRWMSIDQQELVR